MDWGVGERCRMLVTAWPADAAARWPNFTTAEMACRDGCGALPDPEFMDWLQAVRNSYGAAMIVSSGARCEKHNRAVGGAEHSAHLLGMAADVHVDGPSALVLIGVAKLWGVKGLGLKLHGPREGWLLHLDLGPREIPTAWTYP